MKPLSPRECQVIELLVSGHYQKEIAEHLGISVRTVNHYYARIREKADRPTILSAVVFVVMNGQINSA